MASLHEIKDRIGSVKSTLKITSAMKLVASSKLRKAQRSIENLRPYEEELSKILSELTRAASARGTFGESEVPSDPTTDVVPPLPCRGRHVPSDASSVAAPAFEGSGCAGRTVSTLKEIAIIAISSNSSLCGAFNANVIKKTLELSKELEGKGMKVTVYSLGRKMAEAMRKAGYPTEDYSQFIAKPSYAAATGIARDIQGAFDNVLLVYNHFVTTAKQVVVVENWISSASRPLVGAEGDDDEYIIEPGREEVLEKLMPQVLMLRFYAAVLDSAAAEHAARTIAMQTASDNAQELLSELTLEYNKGRQQKITAEILDLVGGISE